MAFSAVEIIFCISCRFLGFNSGLAGRVHGDSHCSDPRRELYLLRLSDSQDAHALPADRKLLGGAAMAGRRRLQYQEKRKTRNIIISFHC